LKEAMTRPTQRDYERLLEFRVTLRRFQRWSEDQAQAAGLTHVQHQLLVAIRGHRGAKPPSIGDLAGYLLLRPHSTVELVDRAEAAGLVERVPDAADGRVVRVRLTNAGDRVLRQLTRAHLDRLHELATVLDDLVAKHHGDAAPPARRGGGHSLTPAELFRVTIYISETRWSGLPAACDGDTPPGGLGAAATDGGVGDESQRA
jgi:DNA-binding MarR family transcriptional regulator